MVARRWTVVCKVSRPCRRVRKQQEKPIADSGYRVDESARPAGQRSEDWMIPSRLVRRLGLLVALAAAYFVTGKLGLRFALVNPSASAVWAPTGIALAAFLLQGYAVWPAIFLGAFLL